MKKIKLCLISFCVMITMLSTTVFGNSIPCNFVGAADAGWGLWSNYNNTFYKHMGQTSTNYSFTTSSAIEYRALINSSLSMWNGNMSVTEVTENGVGGISVKNDPNSTINAETGTTGGITAPFHITKWSITINMANTPPQVGDSYMRTIAHEFGHVFGLADLYADSDSQRMMYGYRSSTKNVTAGDLKGLEICQDRHQHLPLVQSSVDNSYHAKYCSDCKGFFKELHSFSDATCTVSKRCTVCGATVGSPNGHVWTNQTCTAPKTCSICGATTGGPAGHSMYPASCTSASSCMSCGYVSGSALGHKFTTATCSSPKKCTTCGITEGSLGAHSMNPATCTTASTCNVCGLTEGSSLGHNLTPATCSSGAKCSRCGLVQGSAISHNWTEVAIDPYPGRISSDTCPFAKQDCYEKCSVCGVGGKSYTKTNHVGHSMGPYVYYSTDANGVVTKRSTCTRNCGYYLTIRLQQMIRWRDLDLYEFLNTIIGD